MTILEIFTLTDNKWQWIRIAEAKEGQKFTKKGDTLTLDWEHEGKKVKTFYNLNLFPAYFLG